MDNPGVGDLPGDGTQAQLQWKTARLCNSGSCVEVAVTDQQVHVRDNKRTGKESLSLSHDEWRAFVGAVRAGEFDLP